jgi:hypothetical protein
VQLAFYSKSRIAVIGLVEVPRHGNAADRQRQIAVISKSSELGLNLRLKLQHFRTGGLLAENLIVGPVARASAAGQNHGYK